MLDFKGIQPEGSVALKVPDEIWREVHSARGKGFS